MHTPQKSNVGDGPRPSADVRILKGRAAHSSSPTVAGSQKPSAALPPQQIASSVPATQSLVNKLSSVPPGLHAKGTELAASLGLPADRSAFLALAAMLGEHLALTQQNAMSIRRLVKLGHDDPATARLAARALAAGLDPGSDLVERVIESIADPDKDPHEFDRGYDENGDRKQEADKGFRSMADTGEETRSVLALSNVLKTLSMGAGMSDDLASLATPVSDGSGWVCIPFKVPYNGVDFAGIMRVWYDAGAVKAGRLVADIRSGGERRLLDVREEADGRVLRYHADDMKERKAFTEAFSGFGRVITGDLESGDLEELQQNLKVERDA